MCGIVGYIGKKQAAEFLLNGLSKLEYRGYDSAGIAVLSDGVLSSVKTKGRLADLREKLSGSPIDGSLGIGHTRWATHGAPLDKNSHPHLSMDGKIALVHNGIIENYMELKSFLIEKGFKFASDTDTEVVVHLLDYFYEGDMLAAIRKTVEKLKGSFALAIASVNHPDKIYAIKKDSPLIVGKGENENYIASDIPAILDKTRDVYLMNDGEIAVLTENDLSFSTLSGEELKKEIFHVNWDVSAAEKGGYDHFMLKEIHEQPKVAADTLNPHIKNGKVVFDEFEITPEQIKDLQKIHIVGCGSAYHVGLAGKYVIEKLSRIPVDVQLASEFRYSDPIVSEKDLVVLISQSGETADTLAALREAKKLGAKTLSIVNVVGSSIARESDLVTYTLAGPEIAVATTKAYSTQLLMVYLLAIYFGAKKGTLSAADEAALLSELSLLPDKIKAVVDNKHILAECAKKHREVKDAFYIGRGPDYCAAMEGSLKLKEISYVLSEAYAAGELKHGTISLIEEGTLVVAIATQSTLFEKTMSNIKEVKARGAYVMSLIPEGNHVGEETDYAIVLPKTNDLFTPSLSVVAMQIFGYYMSVEKGCDVDKPRNLAKSVTVE